MNMVWWILGLLFAQTVFLYWRLFSMGKLVKLNHQPQYEAFLSSKDSNKPFPFNGVGASTGKGTMLGGNALSHTKRFREIAIQTSDLKVKGFVFELQAYNWFRIIVVAYIIFLLFRLH